VGIIRDGRFASIEPVDALIRRSGKLVRIAAAKLIPIETLRLDGSYDLIGAAILVGMTVGLLVISAAWFARKDV
jgi:hypothetical protein